MLLTLMVLPVARWWEKHVKRRAVAAVITIFMLIVVVGGVLALFTAQVASLGKDAPAIEQKLDTSVNHVLQFVEENMGISMEAQSAAMKEQLPTMSVGIVGKVAHYLQNALTALGLMVMIPIYMFFLLTYRERLFQFLVQLSQHTGSPRNVETLVRASKMVQGYLKGVGMEMVIMTVMASGVFFSLGFKHALLFAMMVAVLNVVPYIGVFVGVCVSVVYAFLTTESIVYPILVVAFLWLIQIVDNNFIAPYVVGKQMRLNPLAIVVAVMVGGLIWGISGMVMFIPLLGMAKVIFDESPALKPFGYLLGNGSHEGEPQDQQPREP